MAALDDAARERLLRQYAPRLAAALGEQARSFTVDERRKLAGKGHAMPDGSFPIVTKDDLASAIRLARTPEQRRHVIKRAGALGAADMIPDAWKSQKSEEQSPDETAASSEPVQRAYTRDREPARADSPQSSNGTNGPFLWNPVVTQAAGRTILTAPATTEMAAMWGEVPNPNPHMLWMQGRFVGGERPNRNGAFWSAGDLEVGKPTVTHGPLNWLHEDKHVIGTIADAKFVPIPGGGGLQVQDPGNGDFPTAASEQSREQAAETADPHIIALSAIWKWVYPQESSVVQMASEAGLLAYSMECISEAVQCVRNEEADLGCGQSFPYMEYARGMTCPHLKERATVRRLVNPTFLGGAVIVPPSRPGWADADARVMAAAADMAEKAYDQAGRPDIPSSTWEQMMAGVITFAQGGTGAIR